MVRKIEEVRVLLKTNVLCLIVYVKCCFLEMRALVPSSIQNCDTQGCKALASDYIMTERGCKTNFTVSLFMLLFLSIKQPALIMCAFSNFTHLWPKCIFSMRRRKCHNICCDWS